MNTEQFSALGSACGVCIVALLALVSSISLVSSVRAQGLTPDAAGNFTTTDANGNTYMFNLRNLSNGILPVTATPAGGVPQAGQVMVQNTTDSLFLVTGNLATGQVSCTVNASTPVLQVVGGGGCALFSPVVSTPTVSTPTVSTLTPAQAAAMATAPSAKSAAAGAVRSQTLQVTNTISDRIRSISRDLASGLGQPSGQPGASTYRGISAGSADTRWGVWGDASGSFIGNNSSVGYDGASVVALSGIDYILDPNWLVGFNAGYTNGQLGLKSFTGTRTSNGALVGPYASYIISPNFSVDGQFSYTRLSNNINTVAPGPTGGFSSNRYTGAADLNAYTDSDGIKLTLFTGYAYTYEGSQSSVLSNVPPFTNSIRFGVFKLGGEAGYPTGDFEPYLPLTFEYQTTKPQDQTGRAALRVGIGVRYQWTDQLKGGLLFTATEFQENWRDLKIEGNLRWTF